MVVGEKLKVIKEGIKDDLLRGFGLLSGSDLVGGPCALAYNTLNIHRSRLQRI